MNNNIKTTKVQIETKVNGIVLQGELEYWAKAYTVRLQEPFIDSTGYQLQFSSPVKYVFEKSDDAKHAEIALKEKSKEILQVLYAKHINQGA